MPPNSSHGGKMISGEPVLSKPPRRMKNEDVFPAIACMHMQRFKCRIPVRLKILQVCEAQGIA
jgi:hypothetical protein